MRARSKDLALLSTGSQKGRVIDRFVWDSTWFGFDVVGRVCKEKGWFARPLRFAFKLYGVMLITLVGSGILVSLLAKPTYRIWDDSFLLPGQIAWVGIIWAYARQPGLFAELLSGTHEVLDFEPKTIESLKRWCGSWIWPLFIVGGTVGCAAVFYIVIAPEDYKEWYWWNPVQFWITGGLPTLTITYFAFLAAIRQSIVGLTVCEVLKPARIEEASDLLGLSLRTTAVGSTLVMQTVPWVVGGLLVAVWTTAELAYHGSIVTPLLVVSLIAYPIGLCCSILLPLYSLSRVLARVRVLLALEVEERIKQEFEDLNLTIATREEVEESNRRIDVLRHRKTLMSDFVPFVPIRGFHLKVVAVGAVLEVVSSLAGLTITATVSSASGL